MKRFAVIVAGGKGLRMGNELPKQFLLLKGKPILMHSIEAFYNFDSSIQCVVVLPESQIGFWKELCEKHEFTIAHIVVSGGKERFFSVYNGISSIKEDGIVAVHDGVRPLISSRMLQEGFEMAEQFKSAVPFIDSVDSLRIIDNDVTKTLDRTKIKRIQTPQFFDIHQLKTIMNVEYQSQFTDEATVWELAGEKLYFYKGDSRNIKITTPDDLCVAEAFMK